MKSTYAVAGSRSEMENKGELVIDTSKWLTSDSSIKGVYKGMRFKISLGERSESYIAIKKESKIRFKVSVQYGIYLKMFGWHKIKFCIPSKKPCFHLWSRNRNLVEAIGLQRGFQELLEEMFSGSIDTVEVGFHEIRAQSFIYCPLSYAVKNKDLYKINQILDKLVRLSFKGDCG